MGVGTRTLPGGQGVERGARAVQPGVQPGRLPAAIALRRTRRPDDGLAADRPGTLRAGDCVAPRTALEAVLEGRRAAAAVAPVPVPFPAPGRGPDRGRTIAVGAR